MFVASFAETSRNSKFNESQNSYNLRRVEQMKAGGGEDLDVFMCHVPVASEIAFIC